MCSTKVHTQVLMDDTKAQLNSRGSFIFKAAGRAGCLRVRASALLMTRETSRAPGMNAYGPGTLNSVPGPDWNLSGSVSDRAKTVPPAEWSL